MSEWGLLALYRHKEILVNSSLKVPKKKKKIQVSYQGPSALCFTIFTAQRKRISFVRPPLFCLQVLSVLDMSDYLSQKVMFHWLSCYWKPIGVVCPSVRRPSTQFSYSLVRSITYLFQSNLAQLVSKICRDQSKVKVTWQGQMLEFLEKGLYSWANSSSTAEYCFDDSYV